MYPVDHYRSLYGNAVMEDVTVEVEDETPPPSDAPDVVVVDTGDDSGGSENDLEIGRMLGEIHATHAAILERLDAMENRTAMAETTAEVALDVAAEAATEAADAADAAESSEAAAEEAAAEAEAEVIEPEREHRLWRSPIRLGRKGE